MTFINSLTPKMGIELPAKIAARSPRKFVTKTMSKPSARVKELITQRIAIKSWLMLKSIGRRIDTSLLKVPVDTGLAN